MISNLFKKTESPNSNEIHTCHVFEMKKKKISIGRGFGRRLGPQRGSEAAPRWGAQWVFSIFSLKMEAKYYQFYNAI
jgi:hypothetical protein